MKKSRAQQPPNVLEMIPSRSAAFEEQEGKIVLLLPRQPIPLLGRFFRRFREPLPVRLHLDEYGGFIWRQIDGRTPVKEIAVALRNRYGEAVEPVYERVGLFINKLAHQQLIALHL
ncbi:MAG: PqqD family protein [candidate division KSB1 bacterium]|nr:PqqD family protein [candidate division KSB1 bacterium]